MRDSDVNTELRKRSQLSTSSSCEEVLTCGEMLRKRKTSTEEFSQETLVRENHAQKSFPNDKVHHKVVRLSSVIWLLLGLLIGKFGAYCLKIFDLS